MTELMTGGRRELSIIVLSCDKYKDLWSVCAHYFETNWRNCSYPTYLLTNKETFHSSRISSLQAGQDRGWSDSVMAALEQVSSKYVLFLLDDAFVVSPFPGEIVAEAMSFLDRVEGTCLRLRPLPRPDVRIAGEALFGQHSSRLPYRNSLFMSIWNRSRLAGYLRSGETAWDFETLAQVRTEGDSGFYAAWDNHLEYIHAIRKGRWFRQAYRRVHNDLPDYSTSRPIMSPAEESLYKAYFRVRDVFVKLIGIDAFRAMHTTKWAIHSWLGPHQAKRLGRSVRKGQQP